MLKKLILLVAVFLVSVSLVYGAGCCEKTESGEWCMFTEEGSCAEGAKFLPTTCEQTSYCSLGCCYSSDEGRCFKNTPRASCTAEGATWTKDPQCEISQCEKGCCIMGDQAFFVTEVKCKQAASQFPELEMVYDASITSEAECVASAKSKEAGCCVQQDSCTFTTRANCPVSEETISGNRTVGFYKDMLCSNDKLECGCAKQQTTGCVGEDLYWFDSCGNRENIYDANKDRSYNGGLARDEPSCTATAYDTDCGNCEYLSGTVCGEDKDGVMPVGEYTCIDLSCEETYEDEISPNAGGDKKNGESWCVYDALPGQARDLVGSRHYRHLCINGEEIVEPCRDFREDICVQGVVGQDAFNNLEALRGLFGDGDYIEAACRDNRYENCYDCNNILSEEVEENGLTPTIIEKRKECCLNEDVRDCFWQPSVTKGAKEGLDGTCVPQVPPGLKFWGDAPKSVEGSEEKSAEDNTDTGKSSSKAEQVCNEGDSECTVVYQMSGLGRLGGFGQFLKATFLWNDDIGWHIVANKECVSDEWVIAGNSICKSLGDCGAYYNIKGELTKEGYYNSLVDEDGFGVDGSKYKLQDSDIGDKEKIVEGLGMKRGDLPGFWDKGGTDMLISASATMAVSGLWAGFADYGGPDGFWASAGKGMVPFSGIMDTMGKAKFGELFTTTLTDEAKNKIIETAQREFLEEQLKSKMSDPIFLENIGMEDLNQEAINKMIQESNTETLKNSLVQGKAFSGETLNKGMNNAGKEAVQSAQPSSVAGGFYTVVQTYMWMRTAAQLIDIFATKTKEVTYKIDCEPWQAPSGGDECETCNDEMKPCSEYKCMSLGAACRLVNKGTEEEKCVAVDTNDVNAPIIEPYDEVLTPPYTLKEVTERGNPGYKLNEKVPAFTPITLGIKADEPAACKYDVKPGTEYEEMTATFGSSMLLYEQEVMFSLPSELTKPNVTLHNQGEYALYVRCKDANGNVNKNDYFIKFNVDDSPDLTPPSIRFTSLENEGYVAADTKQTGFSIYVDEYADCRWSRRDTEFELMENIMSCRQDSFGQSSIYYGTFECETSLTNLTSSKNIFFIRCKDKPNSEEKDRNVMSESFKLTLLGSIALNITETSPEGMQYTNDITMAARTAKGAEKGKAECAFSNKDVQFSEMILFEETSSTMHSQSFTDMPTGSYNYHVSCMDAAGNEARSKISFNIAVDTTPPGLIMAYIDSMYGLLHLEFDEECSCEFSSKQSFAYGEGTPTGANTTVHEMSLDRETFYVKCVDTFGNKGDYTIHTDI